MAREARSRARRCSSGSRAREEANGAGLLKYLNGWSKLQDFPGRMVGWDVEQVSLGFEEACRKLGSIPATAAG